MPAVFVLYTVLPRMKAKNALLLVASVFFYAYGEPIYALLLIFSSLVNYAAAMLIGGGKGRKAVLAAAVVLNLGLLAVFKYSGMFVSTLNAVAGLSLPVPQIALPIGISFFTFQALSYVIDVYRGTVERQKNYFYVLLYISFFPQLIAGPIVKYRDISDRLADRRQDPALVANGMARFICGLAKKVLIANTMGQAADAVFAAAPAD
ncbi:MAG: MBOAT family protein, partial [Clostridia bacterium]|nr:MBOAT family protein [Clostridia bacterium]